jgi:iron complex outermembrane receptor protein
MRIRKGYSASTKCALALGGIGLGVGLPHSGIAQQAAEPIAGLQEVVITAERRSEDIQKTAVAVSVRTGEELEAEGKFSLRSILEDIPGIEGGAAASNLGTASSGTDNQAAGLVIRGIPSNVGVGGAIISVPSAAAVYVDGVYEGVGGGYDISRVEALRGPQGTLYGRSATSGLVATHTRNPTLGQFTGNVSLEAGNYGLRHASGGVNLPLGDTVALRVSGNKYQRDGFRVPQGGSSDITDGRVKLLFQPSDAFSLLVGVAVEKNKTYDSGSTSRVATANSDPVFTPQPSSLSPGHNDYRQYWAELNWDLGFGKLTYQPAYRTWTALTEVHSRPAPGNESFGGFDQLAQTDKDTFWTHELRLASETDSKLAWQVGAFYYDNSLHSSNSFVRWPSGAFYRSQEVSRSTKALSGFAEATYRLTDATRGTAGLRFDQTKVAVEETFLNNPNCLLFGTVNAGSQNYCLTTPTGVLNPISVGILTGDAGKRTFNKSTYKLRLEHDIAADKMVYGMVSTGVSPGDVVLAVDLRPTVTVNGVSVANPNYQKPVPKEVKSEVLTSYEIGSKNRFLDNRLQVNGDVFYYDYGAYTVANANVNGARNAQGVFIPIPTPTQFESLSAPLTTYGLELEALFQATPRDRISFNYAYTKTHFHDKERLVPGSDATFGDFFGLNEVPGAIPHRASLSYDHRFELANGSRFSVGASTRWQSAFTSVGITKTQVNTVYAALLPWIRAQSQFLADLNVNWTSPTGMYSINGWARNVFDNQSKQSVFVSTVSAANVANGTAFNAITGSTFDPRTYGVVFNVKW